MANLLIPIYTILVVFIISTGLSVKDLTSRLERIESKQEMTIKKCGIGGEVR